MSGIDFARFNQAESFESSSKFFLSSTKLSSGMVRPPVVGIAVDVIPGSRRVLGRIE